MSDRPQTVYIRVVQASLAHEATHPLAWRRPCSTCEALRAQERVALAALRTPSTAGEEGW